MYKTLISYVNYWANSRESSIALIDSSRSISYGELKLELIDIQKFLQSKGLKKGDTVAISGEKCINLVVIYLSSLGLGLNVVPVPFDKSFIKKTDQIIRFTDANYIINVYNDKFLITILDDSESKFEYKTSISRIKEITNSLPIDIDDYNYFNLTSGTTGEVKATKTCNYQIIYNATQLNIRFPLMEEDCYCCLFASDMHPHELFVRPLIAGAKSLLLTTKDLRNFKKQISKNNVTQILATPNAINSLLQLCDNPDDWENVKFVLTGGENVHINLRKKFFELTNKKLTVAWGSTETNGIVITLPEAYALNNMNTLGTPLPGYSVKVDPETNELLIKGASCMRGYWRDNGPSPLTNDRYFKTNDMASIDENGIIHHQGRLNSVIKASGRKISLFHLEDIIKQELSIKDCSLVYREETSILYTFVILPQGENNTNTKINNLLYETISPIGFRVITLEDFPRLSNGKINKRELMESVLK
ncbi:class I adenylate-forming enzyme family protein [Psychrobacillus sp. FSL H8-0510]|uniref:class I adenylate-forming enzyme family protein n=1 Tax=Psychrobacillus sp. FSL H8-0510 TaxID=2921394 RepID=UPI0030F829AE